ncbi:MAG: DNA polymerase III subunit epsilon [Cardiobacteriaceae bacterium]|nr:DNA polymerase III subunit epsilon [Cardiobacteriaceae bacterium]
MRQIIFDTETTGLNRQGSDPSENHRIIEIGCIELIDRKFTGRDFHQYLNPQRPIDPESIAVHGITDERVSREPTFAQIYPELWHYLEGADELIAHNIRFDQAFLNRELALVGAGFRIEERFGLVDTLAMARKQFVGQRASLDALCKRFNIDTSHRTLHGALLDAKLLGEVYLKLTGGQSNLWAEVNSEPESSKSSSSVKPLLNQSAFQHTWAAYEPNPEAVVMHESILNSIRKK